MRESTDTSGCNMVTGLSPSLTSTATNRARDGNSSGIWDLSAVEETTVLVFPTSLSKSVAELLLLIQTNTMKLT